jgi:prepilin peptidase CpaA
MIIDMVLLCYIAICVFTDLRYRKVYNSLSIAAVILGLGSNFLYFGPAGLKASVLGLLAGFLFLILFYIMGGIGAGDVKFMAAVGSLKGAGFVLGGGLYGAMIGGIAGILVLVLKKRFLKTVREIIAALFLLITLKIPDALKFRAEDTVYLPYTVFLSLGIILRWTEIYYRG